MSAWDNYDSWKLRTPDENEPDYEVFETYEGKVKYFSCSETSCIDFDKEVIDMVKSGDYEQEEINDALDDIAAEHGLSSDRSEALQDYIEHLQDEKEAAMEQKAEWAREE